VLTHGLAVNDAESTIYVGWGLGGSAPEALGTFDVERTQMALRTVGSGLTGLGRRRAVRHQHRARSGGSVGTRRRSSRPGQVTS